jgi:hypothetical protein
MQRFGAAPWSGDINATFASLELQIRTGLHVGMSGVPNWGTDTGGFLELPPTGKPFRVPVVWLFTLKDNQFAHVRPIYDYTGTLVQIGVLKAKPAV